MIKIFLKEKLRVTKIPDEQIYFGKNKYLNPWSVTIFACYIYVFMEWLFFMTKPSLFDSFKSFDLICALLIPPALLILVTLPLVNLLTFINNKINIRIYLPLIVPTIILGAIVFLTLDNILYTFIKMGVINSGSYTRFLFLALFVLILLETNDILLSIDNLLKKINGQKFIFYSSIVLVTCSVLILAIKFIDIDWRFADVDVTIKKGKLWTPNIIFLASDGMSAKYMSVYGFRYKTTPFLEKIASKSLVFENAFTNASFSTGSQMSLLSGKLPTRLKVGFYPQVVTKEQSFQHLPAILQKLGYVGYQKTLRYYADSGDLNMLGSFNYINGRKIVSQVPGSFTAKFIYFFDLEVLFSKYMLDRIGQRLLHIFGIQDMDNYLSLVKGDTKIGLEADNKAIDDTIEFIKAQKSPFFIHLHLMGSHYGDYKSSRLWFKERDFNGKRNDQMYDYRYMNAIRDADENLRKIVECLKEQHKLNQTLIVISSDHSQKWSTLERIPLIISFPKQEYKGIVKKNVALVDVAPTILDSIGVKIPRWMDGKSLLTDEQLAINTNFSEYISNGSPILTLEEFQINNLKPDDGPIAGIEGIINPGPPLYGVKQVGVIICNHWRKLSLETGAIVSGEVEGHSAPCSDKEMPSDSQIRTYVIKYLTKEGFAVPSWR